MAVWLARMASTMLLGSCSRRVGRPQRTGDSPWPCPGTTYGPFHGTRRTVPVRAFSSCRPAGTCLWAIACSIGCTPEIPA
jgi:hypothetical protein